MSVFFIADTHFGDGNILRYENRPFATVEEMDQELVRRWNQKVGEEDTVFHLGDVSAHSAEEDRQLLGQLHGKRCWCWATTTCTVPPSSGGTWALRRLCPGPFCGRAFSCCPISPCM